MGKGRITAGRPSQATGNLQRPSLTVWFGECVVFCVQFSVQPGDSLGWKVNFANVFLVHPLCRRLPTASECRGEPPGGPAALGLRASRLARPPAVSRALLGEDARAREHWLRSSSLVVVSFARIAHFLCCQMKCGEQVHSVPPLPKRAARSFARSLVKRRRARKNCSLLRSSACVCVCALCNRQQTTRLRNSLLQLLLLTKFLASPLSLPQAPRRPLAFVNLYIVSICICILHLWPSQQPTNQPNLVYVYYCYHLNLSEEGVVFETPNQSRRHTLALKPRLPRETTTTTTTTLIR